MEVSSSFVSDFFLSSAYPWDMLRGRHQSLSTACRRRPTASATLRLPGAPEAQRSAPDNQARPRVAVPRHSLDSIVLAHSGYFMFGCTNEERRPQATTIA